MKNEEMLKDRLNENFAEVSKEEQEIINGGWLTGYGMIPMLPIYGEKK